MDRPACAKYDLMQARALLHAFAFRDFDATDRDALRRAIYRMRTAKQSIVFAGCLPGWRGRIELALALALLPDRMLRVASVGDAEWDQLLRGRVTPEAVWIVRGVDGPAFDRTVAALNVGRDVWAHESARVWIWTDSTGLARLPTAAPDLWRFRSGALDLKVRPIARVELPQPRIGWTPARAPADHD